jgi:hypothetical protein
MDKGINNELLNKISPYLLLCQVLLDTCTLQSDLENFQTGFYQQSLSTAAGITAGLTANRSKGYWGMLSSHEIIRLRTELKRNIYEFQRYILMDKGFIRRIIYTGE